MQVCKASSREDDTMTCCTTNAKGEQSCRKHTGCSDVAKGKMTCRYKSLGNVREQKFQNCKKSKSGTMQCEKAMLAVAEVHYF